MTGTPDRIGPYEVVRPIAQGGMAEVYEVVDPATGERLALKLLAEAKSSIKRFNREFEALTRLNHPGIVRVYRYGYQDRQPWITMELLAGDPIQTWIKHVGEPGDAARTTEVVRIGYFLAQALQYIHDRGLVHRDLKSANVQVLPDGRVKIIDFGTAHLAHPLERITQEGDFVGTFSYAAPEQILGGTVDARADLYALGVLLYRMATGRRPFRASEPQKVAQLHLKAVARPVREVVPELPESLERLIQWLMEKRRSDRPATADAVARALEEIAGHALTLPGSGLVLAAGESVGREKEHRRVWSTIQDGRCGRLVLVVGGDSRERRRFARRVAQDASRRALRGVLVGTGVDPARSWIEAMRSLASGQGQAAGARVLQVLGDARSGARRSWVPLGQAVAEDVATLVATHDRPTVVVLEEAEELDASAMSLVHGFAGACQRRQAPMTLVATVSGPESAAAVSLRRAIAAVGTVSLAPMDVRETALTVGELLHRRPAPMELARHVYALSQGHPSRVEAAVRTLVDDGAISVRSDDDNRLEWTGARATVAASVALDDIDGRLDTLPIAWRRALEVVAIAGGAVWGRTLAVGLGWDDASVRLIAEDLVEEGLLSVTPDRKGFQAADPVLLHVVGQGIHPARRLVVQQLIVDCLPTDPPTAAAVRVLVAVGRGETALRRGVACAQELMLRGAFGDALGLLEDLRSSANHPGLELAIRAEFHLLLGRCARAVRPLDPLSIRSLHAADKLAEGVVLKARVQEAYAELQAAIGHHGNYRKHLQQGWELVGSVGGPEAASLALKLGWNRLQEGDFSAAMSWLAKARSAWAEVGPRAAIFEAQVDLRRGDLAKAGTTLEAVIQGAAGDAVLRWEAVVVLAHVLRRQGRFSDALAPLETAVEQARDGVSQVTWMLLLLTLAEVELDLARLGIAQERADEAMASMSRGESLELRLMGRFLMGRIQLASGQIGVGRYVLQEVSEQAELAGLVLLAEAARGAYAEAQWASGNRRESMELYRQAVVRLVEIGDLTSLADVLVSRARAVGGLEDPARSFKFVAALLDKPEFRILYLESALAHHRFAKASGDAQRAQQALAEARSVFNSLAGRQKQVEQSALRVHPWMHEIRRALEK